MRTGDQDSILFIRSAQRSDSGRYELTVHLEGLEAKANIDILVIGTRAGGKGYLRNTYLPPPIPDLMVGEGRLGYHGKCQILGGDFVASLLLLTSLHNLILQRNPAPRAASGYWMSGVAMQPSSGLHPRTQATQSSWATRCRRQTKRQG